jgi:Transglutaminase-like superfamily/Coenzyme PQQ synthesis protein D (PqqD)
MTPLFALSAHVRWIDHPDGLVVMNRRSGHYLALNRVGASLWRFLGRGAAGFADLERALAEEFPDAGSRLEADLRTWLDHLAGLGLIVSSSDPTLLPAPRRAEISSSSVREDAATTENAGAGPFRTLGAWVRLAFVDLLLKTRGFDALSTWLERRAPARRNAGAHEVATVCAAVDRAARFYPKRAWCLQRSAATAAWLRARGCPAELVVGVKPLPFMAHAWVELDGKVVNDVPQVKRRYEVIDRIGAAA